MAVLTQHADGVVVSVRVVPGASKTQLVEWQDDAVRIRLAAPPVEGKANDELVRFLATSLALRKRDLELLSGDKNRLKRVLVRGLTADDVHTCLTALIPHR